MNPKKEKEKFKEKKKRRKTRRDWLAFLSLSFFLTEAHNKTFFEQYSKTFYSKKMHVMEGKREEEKKKKKKKTPDHSLCEFVQSYSVVFR